MAVVRLQPAKTLSGPRRLTPPEGDAMTAEEQLASLMRADAKEYRRHLYGRGGQHVGAHDASKTKPRKSRKPRCDRIPDEERAMRARATQIRRNIKRRAARAAARAGRES